VARQDSKGLPKDGFQIKNALNRIETLKGMTIWAAYAAFEEKQKGSLEKGKVADFIVLDTDIMNCKIEDVLKTEVLATYINGEEVFSGE
jgi:predicted amidohydrolase YtcJ